DRRGGNRAPGRDARSARTSGSVPQKCWWRARAEVKRLQRVPTCPVANAPDPPPAGDVAEPAQYHAERRVGQPAPRSRNLPTLLPDRARCYPGATLALARKRNRRRRRGPLSHRAMLERAAPRVGRGTRADEGPADLMGPAGGWPLAG